jgi:hypothetical protein
VGEKGVTPTLYVVEKKPYGSVGRFVPALPENGWATVQNKKNSQGMYFLVDRTGQEFSANPPGNVTRNGVNCKVKSDQCHEKYPGP